MVRALFDRLVPRSALSWDWERPFCDDSHIWSDPRVGALHPISELFPIMRATRAAVVFPIEWA